MNAPENQPRQVPAASPGTASAHSTSSVGGKAQGWTPDQVGAVKAPDRRLPHVLLTGIALFFVLASL